MRPVWHRDVMTPQKLLVWYNTLYSRTVDLVGDYAGDELFIIDGDSLLLQSFSDRKLDFSPGFQDLHATYLVETLLHKLQKRNCVFHIAFFAENAHLCVPVGILGKLRYRYLLAREAIIRHLRENIPAAGSAEWIKEFSSYRSSDFRSYLLRSGAYFFMCHDGAFPESSATKVTVDSYNESDTPFGESDAADDEERDKEQAVDNSLAKVQCRIDLRRMIYWFMDHGYNIALINSLGFRDTKVISMILERPTRNTEKCRLNIQPDDDALETEHSGNSNKDGFGPDYLPGPEDDAQLYVVDPGAAPFPEQKYAFRMIADLPATMYEKPGELPGTGTIDSQLLKSVLATLRTISPEFTQREYLIFATLITMAESGSIAEHELGAARAMLLHMIFLRDCSLSDRAIPQVPTIGGQNFLDDFAKSCLGILRSLVWQDAMTSIKAACDLYDLLDGRLFLTLWSNIGHWDEFHKNGSSVWSDFEGLCLALKDLCGFSVISQAPVPDEGPQKGKEGVADKSKAGKKSRLAKELQESCNEKGSNVEIRVLPFSNPVFDVHLQPVHLSIDESAGEFAAARASKTFEELSHWHNSRRPVDHKAVCTMTARQNVLAQRRNDFFMKEMRDYAASLTNVAGGILEPESVFVASAKDREKVSTNIAKSSDSTTLPHQSTKKNARKLTKPSVRDAAASFTQEKRREAREKQIKQWKIKREGFDKENDLISRYVKTKQYFSGMPKDKRGPVEAEILTYQLDTLVRMLLTNTENQEKHFRITILALIWEVVWQISKLQNSITVDVATCVTGVTNTLGLPDVDLEVRSDQKLSFDFSRLTLKKSGLSTSLSPLEFQLTYTGPFMDRDMDSAPDSRIHDFEPDKWQRDVLDQIDAKKSVFVVAPTSAGKTFISFYAMKQILEDDDDGILVYVAPTKALVSQIAAEVQARFSKSYPSKFSGKSVWAIHTRDYRINSPVGCQVLITVPHILQIMLLAPANANSWSSRVRRIIFDEIHCIGQAEDGVVWEQLLLMSPCPIIALSATKANGVDLKMIEHRQRYSNLRKYIYHPPEQFSFSGLSEPRQMPPLGLEDVPGLAFVHPVASLVDRSRGMPDDLSFEPRDCLMLWKAMKKHETPEFLVDRSLDPTRCLPNIVRKADVVRWETKLKALLTEWIINNASPFNLVLNELTESTECVKPTLVTFSKEPRTVGAPVSIDADNLLSTTLPLVCSLHDQNALPALFFNYDRSMCERICRRLLDDLVAAEESWKALSPVWKRKLAKWEEWKRDQEKLARKRMPKASKKGAADGDDMSRAERMREAALAEASQFESFNPDAPVDGFHVANVKKLSASTFGEYAVQLRRREVAEWLIMALRRGIGVHHAGMNRKYRQICEMLFRKGYLRVVIATGTLALGINMPCKTVVFSGDSIFLTALNYRQAAGRAGRRGFDMLGNVIFQGIPHAKVCRLISSRLPHLNGHFPITTSLVLRLCTLLHESKNAPYAVKAINSILSCPRIYLGGPEMKDTVLHHLRFSLEYLRRNDLLDRNGAPLNFAGCVSHLYYTENSSFAFHALLNAGYFHGLCAQINHKPQTTLLSLMLVMCHLFGRQYVRQAILEQVQGRTRKSTSIVVLPTMPNKAVNILRKHNEKTLDVYKAYVATFIEQHITEPDHILPFTNTKCGGNKSSTELGILPSASTRRVRITSPFHALSGHGDNWSQISDLCQTIRSGVWLEEAVVPYVSVYPNEGAPLNAYLYDFFKHGNVRALERENGVRRGDIWFVLNDFSLILATIVASLENFLKLTPGTELDMLDVMGGGEAYEMEVDGTLSEAGVNEEDMGAATSTHKSRYQQSGNNFTRPVAPTHSNAEKMRVVENWDDDLGDGTGETKDGTEDAYKGLDDALKLARQAKEKEKASRRKNRATQGMSEGHTDSAGKKVCSATENDGEDRILLVLKAFKMLQKEFNAKFKAMWA
ncbi:hypothetical protein N7522_011924 [Penicillium canescens]|nr:hypothetical protein N7522_011924 [Penicillium canescens]